MYSTASEAVMTPEDVAPPYVAGLNANYRDKRAECEGGAPIAKTKFAGRQFFAGTLTGDYRDFGSYPWRWYLMADLTQKPAGYDKDAVWCEEESLILIDD
jgi:hypothetical protein